MKNRSTLGTILLIALVAIVVVLESKQAPPRPAPIDAAPSGNSRGDAPTESSPRADPSAADSTRPQQGFRSRQALQDHFEKHGSEFGPITIEQYLKRAQALRDAPANGSLVEVVRSDGVITRFDRRSGAFGAFNPDGTIRTFFKPDDGEAYFKRQAGREPQDQ